MLEKKRQGIEFVEPLNTNVEAVYCDLCCSRFPDGAEVQVGADKNGWVLILCDHCWDLTQKPTADGFSAWRHDCYLEKDYQWGDVSTIRIDDLD